MKIRKRLSEHDPEGNKSQGRSGVCVRVIPGRGKLKHQEASCSYGVSGGAGRGCISSVCHEGSLELAITKRNTFEAVYEGRPEARAAAADQERAAVISRREKHAEQ